MQLELYLKETQQLAEYNATILNEVRQRLINGETLSKLEKSGVLHALQVLIENAIGKAKITLKHHNKSVPISAYDAFESLAESDLIHIKDLKQL